MLDKSHGVKNKSESSFIAWNLHISRLIKREAGSSHGEGTALKKNKKRNMLQITDPPIETVICNIIHGIIYTRYN